MIEIGEPHLLDCEALVDDLLQILENENTSWQFRIGFMVKVIKVMAQRIDTLESKYVQGKVKNDKTDEKECSS